MLPDVSIRLTESLHGVQSGALIAGAAPHALDQGTPKVTSRISSARATAIWALLVFDFGASTPAFSAATDAERRICADRNEDAARKVTSCTIVLNDPSDPSLHLGAFHQRGLSYFRLKNFDRAIADYDAAIKLNPKFTLAYAARSLAYCTKGDHDRGIEDVDQAIKLDPQSSEMHLLRGNCNNEKGAWGQALADFTEAIKLNPNDYRAYNFRADIYRKHDNERAALADYGTAIRLGPGSATAIANAACCSLTKTSSTLRSRISIWSSSWTRRTKPPTPPEPIFTSERETPPVLQPISSRRGSSGGKDRRTVPCKTAEPRLTLVRTAAR